MERSDESRVMYDLIFDFIGLGPCTHHPGIVEGNHGHNVDTFGLDL